MPPEETIKALLTITPQPASEYNRSAARKAARIVWSHEAVAALKAAQTRVDRAWERMLDALPDDLDEDTCEDLPDPPEQAELDALHAELEAIRTHNRWPRKMHWGDV